MLLLHASEGPHGDDTDPPHDSFGGSGGKDLPDASRAAQLYRDQPRRQLCTKDWAPAKVIGPSQP